MLDKVKIAVLMGGVSREHSVSLKSAAGVTKALSELGFSTLPILIHENGDWEISGKRHSIYDAIPLLRDYCVSCVFIALHGANGEDGKMQGMLDLLGLPYTGSGCEASALAMDKIRSKAVCQSQGIPMAGHIALDYATWLADPVSIIEAVKNDIGFPCVIKAASQGSSYGIAIPLSQSDFESDLEKVFLMEPNVMIETYIQGVEVTCSVLDVDPDGMIRPLPLTEIRPRNSTYFDFEAKYTVGGSEEITPAQIEPMLAEQIKEYAVYVHEIIGCKGWSRSDFIIGPTGPIWIEINTIPGLTETSLFPQAAAAVGISYNQLIRLLVDDALRRGKQRTEICK